MICWNSMIGRYWLCWMKMKGTWEGLPAKSFNNSLKRLYSCLTQPNFCAFFFFIFYTERQTKELCPALLILSLLRSNFFHRRAGEREAVRLRRRCWLQRWWCGEPGGAAHQPEQELGGPPGSYRGALPGLPEWSPELWPGGGSHLHRLQQLLHWHGTVWSIANSSILTL